MKVFGWICAVILALAVGTSCSTGPASFVKLADGTYQCQAVFVNAQGKYELEPDANGQFPTMSAVVNDDRLVRVSPSSTEADLQGLRLVRRGSHHFHATADTAVHSYHALACDFVTAPVSTNDSSRPPASKSGIDPVKQLKDKTPKGWQRVFRDKYTYAIPADWSISKQDGTDSYATSTATNGGLGSLVVTNWITSPVSLKQMGSRIQSQLESLGARNVSRYKSANPTGDHNAKPNAVIYKYQTPSPRGWADGYTVVVNQNANRWVLFELSTFKKNPDALFDKVIRTFIVYP